MLRFGDDGFKFPLMILEPELDAYNPGDNYRSAVGNRLNIQQTMRKTAIKVRQNCLFVEWPNLGHNFPDGKGDLSKLYRNSVVHPEAPSHTPTNDAVFGIRDAKLVDGVYRYKYENLMSLWYRHHLLGNMPLKSMFLLGIRMDLGPFSIPGAHDYDWDKRTPTWENDWGPNFKVYSNNNKLYIKDETNDEVIDVLGMHEEVKQLRLEIDQLLNTSTIPESGSGA